MWQFSIVSDYGKIFSEPYISEWMDLYRNADTHVFNHPGLIRAWIDTFGKVHDIRLLWIEGISKNGGKTLWPLVIWHRNWKNAFMRVVMPAGGSDYDYHTPLISKPCDVDEYFQELMSYIVANIKFDELALSGIPSSFFQDYNESGWIRGEICPALNISEMKSSDDLFAFLKTSLRGDLRRQMRRMEEMGPVSMTQIKTYKEAMVEYEAFIEAHCQRWPNAYKVPGFHKELMSDELLSSVVNFSVLKIGDFSAAWHLGFEDKGIFYYYMPAGNPDFSRLSPVKVHLFKLIERAICRGYKTYDHLRGEENYKSGWSDITQYVCSKNVNVGNPLSILKRSILNIRKFV